MRAETFTGWPILVAFSSEAVCKEWRWCSALPQKGEVEQLDPFRPSIGFCDLVRGSLIKQFLKHREDTFGGPLGVPSSVSERDERTIAGLDEESILVLCAALLWSRDAVALQFHEFTPLVRLYDAQI